MRRPAVVSPSYLVCGTGTRQIEQTNVVGSFFLFLRHNFLSFLVLIGFTKENLENILKKKTKLKIAPGTSPVIQWLRYCASTAGAAGSICGQKNRRKMPLSLLPGGQSFLMTVLPYFNSVFTSTGVYRHIYLMYNWVKEFYSKGRMELHKQGTLVPAHPPTTSCPPGPSISLQAE